MGQLIRGAALVFSALLITVAAAQAESFCFDEAGDTYRINPQILRAIAKVESNYTPEAVNRNTNGSYDFGVMQINSIWAATLGEKRWSELGDACTNIKTGAMILSTCMKKYGYTWQAIGCYNSQTPGKSEKYARRVFKQLQKIQHDDRTKGVQVARKDAERAKVPQVPAVQENKGPVDTVQAATAQVVELNGSAVFEVDKVGM